MASAGAGPSDKNVSDAIQTLRGVYRSLEHNDQLFRRLVELVTAEHHDPDEVFVCPTCGTQLKIDYAYEHFKSKHSSLPPSYIVEQRRRFRAKRKAGKEDEAKKHASSSPQPTTTTTVVTKEEEAVEVSPEKQKQIYLEVRCEKLRKQLKAAFETWKTVSPKNGVELKAFVPWMQQSSKAEKTIEKAVTGSCDVVAVGSYVAGMVEASVGEMMNCIDYIVFSPGTLRAFADFIEGHSKLGSSTKANRFTGYKHLCDWRLSVWNDSTVGFEKATAVHMGSGYRGPVPTIENYNSIIAQIDRYSDRYWSARKTAEEKQKKLDRQKETDKKLESIDFKSRVRDAVARFKQLCSRTTQNKKTRVEARRILVFILFAIEVPQRVSFYEGITIDEFKEAYAKSKGSGKDTITIVSAKFKTVAVYHGQASTLSMAFSSLVSDYINLIHPEGKNGGASVFGSYMGADLKAYMETHLGSAVTATAFRCNFSTEAFHSKTLSDRDIRALQDNQGHSPSTSLYSYVSFKSGENAQVAYDINAREVLRKRLGMADTDEFIDNAFLQELIDINDKKRKNEDE